MPSALAGADCRERLAGTGLPLRVKVSGKPKAAQWGRVNKILGEYVADSTRLQGCDLTFQEVFAPTRPDAFFPILFNVLRLVPESSLEGAEVYTRDGTLLGHFSNIVIFEKRGATSYRRHYFQYRDLAGELQAAGNPDLIDISRNQPLFLFKWQDLQDQPILVSEPGAGS